MCGARQTPMPGLKYCRQGNRDVAFTYLSPRIQRATISPIFGTRGTGLLYLSDKDHWPIVSPESNQKSLKMNQAEEI
jgi:hypothetical protein